MQGLPPHWIAPAQAVLPQRTVQLVASLQSIAPGQPDAGQSMEQAISFGHLMSPVHGLQAVPQANVHVPLLQVPPAAMQSSQAVVATGVPQTMPPPPPPPVPGPPAAVPPAPLPAVPVPFAPALPVLPPAPIVPALPVVPAIPLVPALPVVPTLPAPPVVPTLPAMPVVPTLPAPPVVPASPAVATVPPFPPEALAPPVALDRPALSMLQPPASRPTASHATRAALDRVIRR
jgi:A-kinase anchor protein 14